MKIISKYKIDFDLQKPNRDSIKNNILVEDQSSDTDKDKTSFKDLTGDILDCIQEFTGEDFPQFVFTSKQVMENYIQYQRENWQLQKDMMDEQIDELKQEMKQNNGNQSTIQFLIPDELYEKQETLEDLESWDQIQRSLSQGKLSDKEITVLRIYFTFLNMRDTLPNETDNSQFIFKTQIFQKKLIQFIAKYRFLSPYLGLNDLQA